MTKLFSHFLLFCMFPMVVASGLFALADYSSRPGDEHDALRSLSAVEDETALRQLRLDLSNRSTLVLFYHPHCPCTVATFRMLERISTRFTARPRLVFFAYCPLAKPDQWIESRTTRIANRLSNSRVVIDRDAKVCREFGVNESGHLLLYNAHGQLVFSGGITPGRGHEGDCPAAKELLRAISGTSARLSRWPVFGCPIVSDEAQSR